MFLLLFELLPFLLDAMKLYIDIIIDYCHLLGIHI